MNRGIARRTVIEGRRDAGEFLSCVRRVVEEGLLEVHVYCLMGSHFHMLVRSPKGNLSQAMMLIQNLYARWFNRGRRRDGPLWRGRFQSKVIRSERFLNLLVDYIDQNPVKAGIVAAPESYEFGSAWHYSRTLDGPPWLSRSEIEGIVKARLGKAAYDPSDYGKALGTTLSNSAVWMIERYGFARTDVENIFTDLVNATRPNVKAWIRRKARLADGVATAGACVIDPDVLLASVKESESTDPEWWIRSGRRRKSGWRAARCVLLYQVCGCTQEEIGRRVGLSANTVKRHLDEHAALTRGDSGYERRLGEVLSRVLSAEYGAGQ